MAPSQVILFSQGRTACHLLERMVSSQPNTHLLWHPMAPARPSQIAVLREDSVKQGIPADVRQPYEDAVNAGITAWEKAFEECQAQGKTLFVHEHPQFASETDVALQWVTHWRNPGALNKPANFTMIPDEVLLRPNTTVIMTNRHPGLVVPAGLQAMQAFEDSGTTSNQVYICTMHWQRVMYDWLLENGIKPVIVETEDYLTNPDIVRKLCSEVGLDPKHALFSWPRATEEEKAKMDPIIRSLLNSLLNSTGLDPSKAKPPPDMEEEQAKWEQKFGGEAAQFMRDLVEAAMPDYEYLRARKLTL